MATNYMYQNPYLANSYMNYPQAPQQQNASAGIVWVQGEAGAKSYLVAAGQSVLLMDSESSRFYIKSTDTSGMPMPLRVFEYTEKTQAAHQANTPQAGSQYVTHEELKKWTDDMLAKLSQEGV